MDLTSDFVDLVSSTVAYADASIPYHSLSPFFLRAVELLSQFSIYQRRLDECYIEFVDFHRLYPKAGRVVMSIKDRPDLIRDGVTFATTFAGDIQDLRQSIALIRPRNQTMEAHYGEIKLSGFTHRFQKMQNQATRLNVDPYSLLSSSKIEGYHEAATSSSSRKKETTEKSVSISSTHKTIPRSNSYLSSSLAERYEGEIGSVSKINEYRRNASKYRETLLKEAKELQSRFTEDAKEAHHMEKTVSNIASMLSEFVNILQSQSGITEDIRGAAVYAYDHVKDTDAELLLTLQRSQSHSRNVILLSLGLGLLLLLLDFINP